MLALYDKYLATDKSISWYFTNVTFDFCMLANSGARPPIGPSYCTLAMDWLLDENRQGRHGLKETAKEYLNLNMEEFKEAFEGRKRTESLADRLARAMQDDFRRAIDYASTDAWATFRVFHEIKKRLQKEETSEGMSLWEYFEGVEMPFTRVLYNLIRRGIMVDAGYLVSLVPILTEEITTCERAITKIAGREINLRSVVQLRWLLFEKLELEPFKMTKGGESGKVAPSTDEEVLNEYAEQGIEVCQKMLRLRKLNKVLGTYVNGLSQWTDNNLRIHPTLTQHVTVTGRLSSVDPNLQNIPRPDGDEFGLREAFIPKEGYIFVVADYEQLEMRLLAHMSGEKNMIDVINKGWDIHAGTACLMYNHEYEDMKAAIKKKKMAGKDPSIVLTQEEKDMNRHRQEAKSIGFGRPVG
jgi:DNA polymerase-1